jgi:hypothetical protein
MRVGGVKRPRYALRRGFKVWQLIFDRKTALIQHEAGLVHVAWLLAHPGAEPIHALDLAGRAAVEHPEEKRELATGLPVNAVVRQRSLTMENSSTTRAVWRKQRELEGILEDERESEQVKAEAQRELDELMFVRSKQLRQFADDSARTAHAVRRSIRRLYHRLARAVDAEGKPHRVFRAFAAHLQNHLLIPSRRWAGSRAAGDYPGCLVYEPPRGVWWVCD